MPVKDYNADPDLNTQISGINIAEGCAPSGINNAIRQLMADVKEESEAQAQAVSEAESSASSQVSALESTLRALIAEEVAKAMAAANAAYPKSGGQLNGTIIRNGFLAQNYVDDNLLIIRGGTDATSAYIGLCGKKHSNKGAGYITAADGTDSSTLFVSPDGGLSCKSKSVWDGFAPTSERTALTIPSAGTVITAPHSGYISLYATSNHSDTCFVTLYNQTAAFGQNSYVNGASNALRLVIPVRKNDKVLVSYNRVTVESLIAIKSVGGTI